MKASWLDLILVASLCGVSLSGGAAILGRVAEQVFALPPPWASEPVRHKLLETRDEAEGISDERTAIGKRLDQEKVGLLADQTGLVTAAGRERSALNKRIIGRTVLIKALDDRSAVLLTEQNTADIALARAALAERKDRTAVLRERSRLLSAGHALAATAVLVAALLIILLLDLFLRTGLGRRTVVLGSVSGVLLGCACVLFGLAGFAAIAVVGLMTVMRKAGRAAPV